jgi:hypothetical protein
MNTNLIREPFTRMKLEEEQQEDIFTIRLNKEEREILNKAKLFLRQPKDGTAIKQLARLGSLVLHEEKMALILDVILNNNRRNQRTGINEIDIK